MRLMSILDCFRIWTLWSAYLFTVYRKKKKKTLTWIYEINDEIFFWKLNIFPTFLLAHEQNLNQIIIVYVFNDFLWAVFASKFIISIIFILNFKQIYIKFL